MKGTYATIKLMCKRKQLCVPVQQTENPQEEKKEQIKFNDSERETIRLRINIDAFKTTDTCKKYII